ncbi:uncharacterized protein LOC112462576 isoform X1 [Temnothorax curvispinosus]|uniref:Uncharacterized protein LOC112462576 isoform X1 n=1 Tax=Temnothorax curvispinosus TaxID=300111 RepID=A0A6J1QUA8_9HYME|nr:uncharacterized protein LOC112462576 isoform X1 [Temnothorax curvispinosus]
MDNKSKIIETARQKHKCMIEDDTKIVSDATDEENLDPNVMRKDFSTEVQEKKKVLSADNNVSQKTSARSINIETPSISKDNSIYGLDTSGEKSPSSICKAYSPSELRQMSPVTSHITALTSSPSTPRSSRQSGSVLGVSGATYDKKAFKEKISRDRDSSFTRYVSNQEISSKLDMLITNVCRLNRFLLPHEKKIVRPAHFPALPLTTKEELKKF